MQLENQCRLTLSIIIPVYNTENYLIECVNSILEYIDILKNKIELILINDGSTDNCKQICDDFAAKYPYLIHAYHQHNLGLSEARNAGMLAARGQYIMFLDSDDMVMAEGLKKAIDYVERYHGIDILLFDAIIKNETNFYKASNAYQRKKSVESEVVSGKEYVEKWYFATHIVSANLAFYRKKFLEEIHLLFTPGVYHEDVAFTFRTIINSKSLLYIPCDVYVRRYRTGSLTMIPKNTKHYNGYCVAFGECLEEIKRVPFSKSLYNAVNEYLRCGCTLAFSIGTSCGEKTASIENLSNAFLNWLLHEGNTGGYGWCMITKFHLEFMMRNGLEISDENKANLCAFSNEVEIEKCIEKIKIFATYKRKQFILNVLGSNKIFSIYGIGPETDIILDILKSVHYSLEKIEFFSSKHYQIDMNYWGKTVRDINEVDPGFPIAIASYYQKNEMEIKCKHLFPSNALQLVDLYETEQVPLDCVEKEYLDIPQYSTYDLEVFFYSYSDNIKKQFSEWHSKNLRIALWGIGERGLYVLKALSQIDIVIDCLIDINPQKQGEYYFSYKVESPEIGLLGSDIFIFTNPDICNLYKVDIKKRNKITMLFPYD